MRPAIVDASALNARLYLAAEGGHFLCTVPVDYARSAAAAAAEESPSSLEWEVMGSRAARCVPRDV